MADAARDICEQVHIRPITRPLAYLWRAQNSCTKQGAPLNDPVCHPETWPDAAFVPWEEMSLPPVHAQLLSLQRRPETYSTITTISSKSDKLVSKSSQKSSVLDSGSHVSMSCTVALASFKVSASRCL